MTENAQLSRIEAVVNQSLPRMPRATGTERDAARFRARLENWMEVLEENFIPEVKTRIVAETFAGLVRATPVGNHGRWKRNIGKPRARWQPKNYVGGTARRSWRIDVGRPRDEAPPRNDPLATLASARPNDVIWVSNPQPYMEQLNNGWSLQAPAGFVEEVIGNVVAKYRRIAE